MSAAPSFLVTFIGGRWALPGWSEEMRSTGGFRLRHPVGVEQAIPLLG